MYKDFLKIDRQFESAVNLTLDLNKHKKIEEYIPTEASLKVLNEYLSNIENDVPVKASVLIGPYGKGKSHLLLILAAIVSMDREDKKNLEVLKYLIKRIKENDKGTALIAEKIIRNKKRLMPVIINGGYSDLQQTFLLALKDALDRENIQNLTPNTYYQVACSTIAKWKKEYPNTYDQFCKILKDKKIGIESLVNNLEQYSQEAYQLFCKIHPLICAGAIFNPMINMDIVSMYKIVNEEICKKYNYSGMIVIFDEFSKFLENTKLQSPGELKILQDFAEFANRTKVNQVHLLCITHKPIGYYTRDLSPERAMAYRTVEGRFKENYFVSSSEQNYQLIKNSIKHVETKFSIYVKENKVYFHSLMEKINTLGVFPQGIDTFNDIVLGCFPLHPLTTFIAIRISELVAQNERTLFTFLAGHQKYTLRNFVKTYEGNKTLTADILYDYFRDCFQKELTNETIITTFTQTEAILTKECSAIQRKILKVMALIQMINQPNLIQANDVLLKVAIEEDEETIISEIEDLKRKNYIFKRNSDQVYICLNTSNVNLRSKINQNKKIQTKSIDRKGILEKIVPLGYTLPKQFNDKYHMIRFFKNEFITYDELMTIQSIETILGEKRCDGLIAFLLIDEKDDKSSIENKIAELNDPRLIVYVPNKAFDIDEYLKEYIAIQLLKQDKSLIEHDTPVIEELEIYELDVVQAITNYSKNYFALDNQDYKWITLSNMDGVFSKMQLSRILTEICEEVYSRTPILANELINKHNISGPILTARNKLITNILLGEEFVTKGNSPDITIGRALITNKGILEDNIQDKGLKEVLEIIDRFINQSDGMLQNIGQLYDELQKAPYGIRKGVIPVYVAIYFKRYADYLVIYNKKKEVELNFETLRLMDKEPNNYFIFLEQGTSEKVAYLNAMKECFKVEKDSMSFHMQCVDILEAIKIWFRSLPKCSREAQLEDYLEEVGKQFKKQIVKFDINAREFLFDILPNKICRNSNFLKCAEEINALKEKYSNYYDELIEELIHYTKKSMDKKYEGELVGALKNWYKSVKEDAQYYVFDVQTNNLLEYIKYLEEYDEQKVISEIAYIITGLHIEDWEQRNVSEYKQRLENIKQEVIQTMSNSTEDENSVQIILKGSGETKQKIVKVDEISPLGETLLSSLMDALEEYGEAIDTSEKMGILIKVLESVI